MAAVIDILGLETSSRGLSGDIDKAWDIIQSGTKGNYFACNNPHSLVVAKSDPLFFEALSNADLLIPDGVGAVIGSKILGTPLKERVTGHDIFTGVSERSNNEGGVKFFFLGSTNEVLDKIVNKLKIQYPNIEVSGVYSPPYKPVFSDEDNSKMIELINEAKPDVLWVGMTAPKQEKWIYEHKDKLDVKFMGAIGAVFDFYAGTIKRSPDWACKMGLEWLPRLLREPRRLFRRNFISSPLFLLMIIKAKFNALIKS